MKFVHRIGFRANSAQRRELEALGVEVPAGVALPGGGDPLVAFDVDEDHPSWPALRARFEQWNVSDVVRTEFSNKELRAARWLELMSDWHHGYPQPNELDFGYRAVTYDLADYCEQCGIGMKQKAPFQMKGEPKWGKNSILQLNWVFDEYFVRPEVWAGVFEPHGIACRPVTNTQGRALKTVVQLVTREEVGVVTDGLIAQECPSCGRIKYAPVTRGAFPALAGESSSAMAKTQAYFGSGASAHKGVLVSQAMARALAAANVRGASLRPVAERRRNHGVIP